ncbi:endonuclease/exonuclease/phosphatase family protein [Pseudalgibacter alginicilyticus]|uniref:endonuclease/exonuclease/phosphatase family protein n=1 Tax=Pseudalgibacter alginicilyticus TaxID=1736674 RepID=UPI0012FE7CCC|nr:endonuclease/exonuclease/phosphatase family protein [Pseudalgibacter alginicilyticus]
MPVIIFIVLALSVFLGKKGKYNIILAGLLFVIWIGRSYSFSFEKPILKSDLEVVFWNAYRKNNFEKAFIEYESIPDVLVLTESNESNIASLQLKYPDFHFYKSEREIWIFSKMPIDIIKEETSNYNSTVIIFKTHGINFYAVDMVGSADVPRSWEYQFFNSISKNKEKAIILGDFNIPVESLFLNDLKKEYNFYFTSNGNGFRETWFWNIPLLSIDQIWVSKDLQIVTSEIIRTFKSDHAMIKTVVRR